jgi:pSer/pThr/pTyr-binding forkhead associated (FHA) protein
MTEPCALVYRLLVDGYPSTFVSGITIGRHLDNDVVVAGEDVRDFHARIEASLRGPVLVPFGEAVLRLNGELLQLPTGLLPGDRLGIGESELVLEAAVQDAPDAETWRLHAPGDPEGIPIVDVVPIGRELGSPLLLHDPHASRQHAQLHNLQGAIWVRDLGSTNGTYVNGERIRGARRLFHGDEVRFDTHTWQLLGRGVDLTPVAVATGGNAAPFAPRAPDEASPEGGDTLEFAVIPRPVMPGIENSDDINPGVYLVPLDGPAPGVWHRLPMGRTLIGRQSGSELQLRDRTVSGSHAELVLRAEGATLTDLMSVNGTFCNGRRVQSTRLVDGDRVQVGRPSFTYREIGARATASRWRMWLAVALLVAAAATTALLML